MSNGTLSPLLSTIQTAAQQTGLNTPVPPSATALTIELLQLMSAATGTLSDYNVGSNIRTLATTLATIIEQQNITSRVLTAQNILNLLLTAYNVTVPQATNATGQETFTLLSPITSSLTIPTGTQVGTVGGLVFSTTESGTIPAGMTSVTIPIEAAQSGTIYNVPAGTITTLLSSLPQAVTVTNSSPTQGGTNAPTINAILGLLANAILSQGTSTPQSIASAVNGVSISTGEMVKYSTVYEPWLYASGSGAMLGFQVYIDNGGGGASSELITAVQNLLSGTTLSSLTPAGVPYQVLAVDPVYSDVTVTATSAPQYASNIPYLNTLATNAVTQYFQSLNFGDTYVPSDLTVAVVNALTGLVSGVSITPTSPVTALPYQRVILSSLTINISAG
jgi:uncharacterized phage protein gp47/JayE